VASVPGKRDIFPFTMIREVARYAIAVVGLSAAVNFGLVSALTNYDLALYETAAVAAAAVAAALVAWFVSTRILRIGGPAESRSRLGVFPKYQRKGGSP
jgi:hypothetical protein